MTLVQRQQRERDRAIRAALRKHGNIRGASAELGIPRATLHERVQALGLRWKRVRRGR